MNAEEWEVIQEGAPLLPKIYQFVSSNGPMTPSRICRQTLAGPHPPLVPNAQTHFRNCIRARDARCVITDLDGRFCIASHLIPKRLGNHTTRAIVNAFVGAGAPPGLHSYHPAVGVLLWYPHDSLVDKFDLGFYKDTNDLQVRYQFTTTPEPFLTLLQQANHYVLHVFDDIPRDRFCLPQIDGQLHFPPLHTFPITLVSHSADPVPPPPRGIFDWEYLQCVLKHLCTPQYQAINNISYFVDNGRRGPAWCRLGYGTSSCWSRYGRCGGERLNGHSPVRPGASSGCIK
jgi:hypothetical protein